MEILSHSGVLFCGKKCVRKPLKVQRHENNKESDSGRFVVEMSMSREEKKTQ